MRKDTSHCPSMQPRARFAYHLQSRYGMSLPEYEEIFKLAKNCCEICERPVTQGGQGLGRATLSTGVIDHDHKTGKIRGVLCRICNSFLGVIGEEPHRLTNYLKER